MAFHISVIGTAFDPNHIANMTQAAADNGCTIAF